MGGLCLLTPPALIGVPSLPIAAVRTPHHHHSPAQAGALGRNGAAAGGAKETAGAPAGLRHSYASGRPLWRLWPGGGERIRNEEPRGLAGREEKEEEEGEGEWGDEQEEEAAAAGVERRRRADNWVLKILRARPARPAEEGKRGAGSGGDEETGGGDGEDEYRMSREGDLCVGCCGAEEVGGCHVGKDEGEEVMGLDKDAFKRLLGRVSLKEARLFTQLSYLGKIAYNIPRIKPANLLKYHGLCFVTSSLEMKQKLPNVETMDSSAQDQQVQQQRDEEGYEKGESQQKNGHLITAAAAYRIAASAASYIHSQTRSILPFRSAGSELGLDLTGGVSGDERLTSSEVASFVATTNSVTAVVAAKEETKQAVAKDLNSANSSPCEWFICDDASSGTRFLVIQGSESLASWQANLLFEPVQFEESDVIVHRGIYEAAKGIYQQMLPHVRYHLKSHGNSATFRFTGHSLGGSLSLLVSLMLLIRGEVPRSSLLPVVTFGSPYIMCGGDYLLQKLGLPLNYVQAIMMHRDIVPRAFSCNYPDHVAEILKAVSGKFRNHPCLKHQSLLYAPMGQLLILQPEEKFSPHHELLPLGTGLYVMGHKSLNSNDSTRILRLAQSMFLNTPHPLEILSDRAAYGSEGTVYRDHDMSSYLRSLRGVVCHKLKLIRKAKRERRRQMWWPLVASQGINESIVMGRQTGPKNSGPQHLGFSIVIHGGMQSLRRIGRFVTSRHMHMLALLLPAKMLLLGFLRVTSFS